MLTLSSLECNCQYGVKNGYITARWVGECCSELRLIVSRLNWQGYSIEDTINEILGMLAPYQWGWGEGGYVVGGRGGQILWEAEVFEDLYEAKAESDQTKTQNCRINNGQTKLQQLHI